MERRYLRLDESFELKYRPYTWRELIGQDEIVESVRATLDSGRKRCFFFCGPSGLGKTTTARLIARHLGCPGGLGGYLERDAAIYAGIDKMRELTDWMRYRTLRRGGKKVACLDEVHCLSPQAMQALLKSVEEPPSYGYWIFCTTKLDKILVTLMKRCARYRFRPVATEFIVPRLLYVHHCEGLHFERAALEYIAVCAKGSPRDALTYLDMCRDLTTLEEVQRRLSATW